MVRLTEQGELGLIDLSTPIGFADGDYERVEEMLKRKEQILATQYQKAWSHLKTLRNNAESVKPSCASREILEQKINYQTGLIREFEAYIVKQRINIAKMRFFMYDLAA